MTRLACLAALALLACAAADRPGGADVAALPPEVRADYAVFADRCSKCHALSRALESGIVEDEFWARYVDRMRRQPASGISPEDVPAILRFLHHHSAELRRKKQGAALDSDGGDPRATAAGDPGTGTAGRTARR